MVYNFSDRAKNLKANAIREIFKVLADPEMISFAGGFPSADCLPIRGIEEVTAEIFSGNPKDIFQYGATEGYLPLRNSGLEYVKRVGLNNLKIDNIIAISGGQQGIDLMCKALLNKGDVVLVENPTYLACLHILKTYEANAVGIDSDDDGINIEDLERKIKAHKPKFIYLVPNFSNPTGKTLPESKRESIAQICGKYGVLVLEDDPYRELRYTGKPLRSIASYDSNGVVVYCTSFSKTIAPGLRVGLIIGNEEVVRKLTILKQAVDVHTSLLSQAIVNGFITTDRYQSQVDSIVPIYREKRDAMLAAIKNYMPTSLKYTMPDGGLFIWGEFDKSSNVNTVERFKAAIDRKVAYVNGTDFYADGRGDNTLRLNFSNSSLENIEIGIKRLAEVLK